jgi:hypothetical protein
MAGKNHPDRWIPIAPSGEPLSKSDIMKLDSNGLSLRCNYDGLYYVYSLGCGHKRVSRFRITDLNPASMSDPGRRSKRDLWIEFKPPPDDEIDDNDFEDMYIIVERKSSGRLRGARVLLSRRDGDMEFLRYDCALRAEVGPQAPSSWLEKLEVPVINKSEVPSTSHLLLEHSKCPENSSSEFVSCYFHMTNHI